MEINIPDTIQFEDEVNLYVNKWNSKDKRPVKLCFNHAVLRIIAGGRVIHHFTENWIECDVCDEEKSKNGV